MKRTTTLLFTITLLFISYQSFTNAGGPPFSMSNAPGDGNCTSCHTGSVLQTSGTAWNGMTLSVVGATLSTLAQNTTYTFNLTFANSPRIKYGFQLCVLGAGATASSSSLGTLVSGTGSQIVSSSIRDYLEHNSSGTSAVGSTKTWTFQWTTPASYTGGATFYVVVNSTNNDGNLTGDVIYAKTFAATVILPVSWIYTNAACDKNGNVILNWATASEENNWKFDIEKSIDKKEWNTIGEIKGMGNSSLVNKYSFRDENVNGTTAYYRVKQIDFNGAYSYSNIVLSESQTIMNKPSIRYNGDRSGYVVLGEGITGISVTDMTGETKYYAGEYSKEYVIPVLGPGIYLVQIKTATNTHYQKILMN